MSRFVLEKPASVANLSLDEIIRTNGLYAEESGNIVLILERQLFRSLKGGTINHIDAGSFELGWKKAKYSKLDNEEITIKFK